MSTKKIIASTAWFSMYWVFLTSAQSTDAFSRFEEIKAAAEKGDVNAQYELGNCFRTGDGVGKDLTKAI
jgi:TPR repeat protein